MSNIIIRTLYNILLFLLLILGSPWWLWRYIRSERFRAGLAQRFIGPSSAFTAGLPTRPRIWFHAVSVGEVLAISGLVRAVEENLAGYTIVVSTTTRTGQILAMERFGAGRCFYFPLDFPWSVASALRRLQPCLLILAESELWPNLLTGCGRRGVPVIVVNGRVSNRSLPRYLKLKLLWKHFLPLLSLVLAQTPEDALRFETIGVPPEKVRVGGNLKFDVRATPSSTLVSLLQRQIRSDAKVLICGSTVEGEEAILLAAWPEITGRIPEAIMILAPRHPERFARVATLLEASSIPWIQRSRWMDKPSMLQSGSIFLLDSIGELASLYSLAKVAFLGGSLVTAGGHNPLEPARFGVAVTIGEHYENFRGIVAMLMAEQAVVILQPHTIVPALTAILMDEKTGAQMGHRAQFVYERQSGATHIALEAIRKMIESTS